MRSDFNFALLFSFGTLFVFAGQDKAHYFKATITTSDTTITGYFHLPYDVLADSILTKFKSDDEYFKERIKSDSYADGIELYRFLLKYGFKSVENDTTYVLIKSEDKLLIKLAKIKNAKFHDLIVFDSWGYWIESDIGIEDLEWLNSKPHKVIMDTSNECHHQYFIFHETNAEIAKIVEQLVPIKNIDDQRRIRLELMLNDFEVILIKRGCE